MITLNASIETSKQFDFNGKKFVQIQGFLEKIGIFKMTVPEEKIPDALEGKTCSITFDVGVDKWFKPSLKLKSISL